MAELWAIVLKMNGGHMTRKFLENKIKEIEISEQKNASIIVLKIIKSDNKGILYYLVEEGCFSLIKYVTLRMIERKNLVGSWTECDYWESVLTLAVRHQPFEFVRELWEFAAETFEPSEVKNILVYENPNGKNILNCAVAHKKDAKIFEFFVDYARSGILKKKNFNDF